MVKKQRLRVFGGWLRHDWVCVLFVLVGGLSMLLSLTGCDGTGENPNKEIGKQRGDSGAGNGGDGDEWEAYFGGPEDGAEGGEAAVGDGADGGGRWAILVGTFSQGNHAATAEAFREGVAEATGLQGFRVTSRGDRSLVHYGQYAVADSKVAIADLKMIQGLEIEGRKPFGMAFATLVGGSNVGRLPQYSLVGLWKQYPQALTIYSLQVEFYSFDNAKSQAAARRTAEDRVSRLRLGGDAAFYFHGPRMSVVTVGVFFDSDIDTVTGVSRAVRDLQAKYPNNLGNGKEIVETKRLPGGEIQKRVQPSFLISVPRQ